MKETVAHPGREETAGNITVREKEANLTEADLLPGDHIYVRRTRRFYLHHGIYMGDGKVIHFTGSIREKVDPEVRETDLSRFLKGGALKRRDYNERLPASETVRVAKRHISDRNYSIWNNCEHFATYCATGKRKSRQVRRAMGGLCTVAAGAVAAVLGSIVWSRMKKT